MPNSVKMAMPINAPTLGIPRPKFWMMMLPRRSGNSAHAAA